MAAPAGPPPPPPPYTPLPVADSWDAFPSAAETREQFDTSDLIRRIFNTIEAARKHSYQVDISDLLIEHTKSLKVLEITQARVEKQLKSKGYKVTCGDLVYLYQNGNCIARSIAWSPSRSSKYGAQEASYYVFIVDWTPVADVAKGLDVCDQCGDSVCVGGVCIRCYTV